MNKVSKAVTGAIVHQLDNHFGRTWFEITLVATIVCFIVNLEPTSGALNAVYGLCLLAFILWPVMLFSLALARYEQRKLAYAPVRRDR